MASIWKHPKSANLIARFRGAAGKTVNRSTGTPDRFLADMTAQAWEAEAARERQKIIRDPVSPGGLADAITRAERLARQGRLDASAGREILNNLLAAAGQAPLDAITNRSWTDGWRNSKGGAVTQRTQWKYDQVCRDWLKFLSFKADKPVELVGRDDVVAFRDRLRKAGLSARTCNATVKLLRGIYQEAVEQGYLGRNPFAGIGALIEDRDDARREPFTRADVAALISKAEGDWQGLIILSATTGLRLMDAARLQWSSLDLRARILRIKTSKTGAKLSLPIHRAFAKWIAGRKRTAAETAVFPSLASKGGPGKSGLSMAFKTIMKGAGIEAEVARERTGRGRCTSRKSFHSLRHFAATQLAQAGIRAEVARSITGHADAESHAGYITADLGALRSAVATIKLTA